MSFPINFDGLIYDFRSIPLVIGSLYGGIPVLILLYLTLILYRSFMGSPHEWIYAFSIIPSLILVVVSLRFYNSSRLSRKIVISVILITLIKLITFTIYLGSIQQIELLFTKPTATIETYILQGLIVGLCVYLIEFLNNHFHMQEEVAKSEKIMIVSEMAAAVAHEIRNPLTVVRGFIQLLGVGELELDKEKKNYYQKICLEELDRAELIITDYLSLAKPDPEKIEVINVNDEISYLSNILITYSNYNNIQIIVTLFENNPLLIVGEKYKFRQALINIGKNAIEAMNNAGILEIKTNKINNMATIIISDNGIGMTSEQIKRLGIPYYSTKDKGTGLGTMVSFGIIKKMNGKINVKSELGKGTSYEISFPEGDRFNTADSFSSRAGA
jgi:two-component system sporulation sensor kinase B